MLACTASMVVTTIVIGVLLWAILTISRDTVPFGVSVPADRIHHRSSSGPLASGTASARPSRSPRSRSSSGSISARSAPADPACRA